MPYWGLSLNIPGTGILPISGWSVSSLDISHSYFLKGDNRSTWKQLLHFHCEHWEKTSMESQHGTWRDTSWSCFNLHCNYSDNFCLLKHQGWSGYPEGERNSVGEFQPNLGWEVQHFLCIGLKVISMAKGILWETGKQAERKLEILKEWSWTGQN